MWRKNHYKLDCGGKRMKRVHLSFATNHVLELLNMLGAEYGSKSFKEVEKC